jgi:two-component system chemotaxis response regulator CheY
MCRSVGRAPTQVPESGCRHGLLGEALDVTIGFAPRGVTALAKILVIDDSVVARMSVKACIPKDEGHEVFEASDGGKGLEAFAAIRPDVTFLDMTMPVKTGLEVLEEIQRSWPGAIVIVLSADIQRQTQDAVRGFGAFAALKKPPMKELVRAELTRALAQLVPS